jgi:hypothetical protein
MRSHFHIKALVSIRLPSFAGQGLPERMRSTVFAFLGLTAAAGLAVVATFAQLGFPLRSPEPLPSIPIKQNAVSEATAVDRAPQAALARRHRDSAPPPTPSSETSPGGVAQPVPGATEPSVVEPPAPIPSPDASGVNGGQAKAPRPTPAPTPTTPDSSPPPPPPVPEPVPVPVASPPPEATPSALPAGPGNSAAGAAAAHASPRGIEASNGKGHGHGK